MVTQWHRELRARVTSTCNPHELRVGDYCDDDDDGDYGKTERSNNKTHTDKQIVVCDGTIAGVSMKVYDDVEIWIDLWWFFVSNFGC